MSVQGGLALARHALALWVAWVGRWMGVYIHALRGLVRVDTRRCLFVLMQGVLCVRDNSLTQGVGT